MGRDSEIAEVVGLLDEERLITLVGTGGVGKTRLALEVASCAQSRYRDGAWIVELAGAGDGDLLEEWVLAVLPDVDRAPGAAADLFDQLTGRHLLLVLDNCEHVVGGCAALAQQLLRRCPQLSVLATSREPLRVAGERVWWVAPLGLPGPEERDPVAASAAEAVRLFEERGRAASPGFRLTPEVLPSVVEICRRLDGLPLALELAAARMAVLSPAEIVGRLDDRFRLLTDRSPMTAARHQTLLAALEGSHDPLTVAEALLLARLAVFAGGSSLQAVEQVCADATLPTSDILDLLDALVTKSLVVVDRDRPVTRYRMLESTRHFALTKLHALPAFDAVGERHARWCLRHAERAERGRRTRHPETWLEALEEDHDNFRSALGWARDHDRADLVLALGGALGWFWETRGHFREGLDWLTWALARESDGDDEVRARALRSAGMLSWLLGEVAEAMPLVEASVVLFKRAGNDEEAGGCVCSSALHLCANPVHSLQALEADLVRIRAGDDVGRLARALVNCGVAHFFVSDAERARKCFDECLSLPLAAEREVFAEALLGRGRVALLVGDFAGAEVRFREALAVVQGGGDDDCRSAVWTWIGELHRVRGDYRQSRRMFADATALAVDGGAPLSLARCRQFLGRLEATEGNLAAARSLFAESLALPGAKAMSYHRVRSLQGMADIALARGERDDARPLIDEALSVATVNGDIQAQARALSSLAVLARLGGDGDRAAKLAHQVLDLEERIGDPVGKVSSLEALAELATLGGRSLVAARLFGAVQGARRALGFPRAPVDEPDHERHLAVLAASLAPGELDQALAQGMTMSLAEAVSYATKGWGSKTRPATGWASLTRAERDVAALAGEGLTNREIGDRLFVSARTVATHLSHIYHKLDMVTRRDLIRAARPLAGQGAHG